MSPEAKLSRPGSAFARAISPARSDTPRLAAVMRTTGDCASIEIGAKSANVSKGRRGMIAGLK